MECLLLFINYLFLFRFSAARKRPIETSIPLLDLVYILPVDILGRSNEEYLIDSLLGDYAELELPASLIKELVEHYGLRLKEFEETRFNEGHIVLLRVEHEHFKHQLHAFE